MNLLLTGASGFLGRNLVHVLENQSIFDKIVLVSSKHFTNFQVIKRVGSIISVDSGDSELLKSISHVLHLGSFMPRNQAQLNDPHSLMASIQFTKNLLALPFTSLQKVVFASTTDVYKRSNTPMSEDTTTVVTNGYTNMKLEMERLLTEFCEVRKIELQILRIGHLFGAENSDSKKFVPTLFNCATQNKIFSVKNGLDQKLNLLYVTDAAQMISQVSSMSNLPMLSNLVSSFHHTIGETIELVEEISGKSVKFVVENEKLNKYRYLFSPSNLNMALDFTETPFKYALSRSFQEFEF